MEYLAHIDGERKQTIKEHLNGTAQLAESFAGQFGKNDWGYCCGMLHDIGKYSVEFQKKIKENSNKRVDHSSAGAQVCFEKKGLYWFISYCIAGHHAGLPDYGNKMDDRDCPSLMGRVKKKIPDYQRYKTEIEIPELKSIPFELRKSKNPDFSLSVFIRMLYSCLVDADFLDTERFMKDGLVERDSGETLDILLEKLETYIADWLFNQDMNTVNGRRTEILKHCLECGKMARGLFLLTVPTGGGKTISSLSFALRHAVKNRLERVIYVIPYTSIIEQNVKIFREILGQQNVLENHWNVEYEDSEELKPLQLAAENWDKPVVVTTNVQFFESLFSNKSSKCRKLHNIANSVIIFDEAQMLPNDYLKPCVAMIEELIHNYQSSVVLCTATQPALTSQFQSNIKATELCPRMQEQFQFFERVTFRNIGIVTEENLIQRLEQESQVLCIVNTKRRAQNIYQKLKNEGVYHLSTTMYPKHRRRILEKIRERLQKGEKCILISTSLVEAGVDLDFKAVYRQIAGVDSIIQAAGRCNREGKRKLENSIVSIFEFEEQEKIPSQRQQIDTARILLAEEVDISSLETIEEYFKRLYHFRGESLDKKKIMEELKDRKYNFAKVSKEFKIIDEATKTIFISKEEKAGELLKQMKYKGYTKTGMRKVGQYCIQIRNEEFKKLYDAGMVKPVLEDIEDFYELVNKTQYTEDMGLNLNIHSGMAIFE